MTASYFSWSTNLRRTVNTNCLSAKQHSSFHAAVQKKHGAKLLSLKNNHVEDYLGHR